VTTGFPPLADISEMKRDYLQMLSNERDNHHDEVRAEGFEWCPECGEPLVWDLPASCVELDPSPNRNPVVTGDCPPLTRDQLATTTPA
jgi:hypothetical protein